MSASARVSPVSFTDPEPVLTSLEELQRDSKIKRIDYIVLFKSLQLGFPIYASVQKWIHYLQIILDNFNCGQNRKYLQYGINFLRSSKAHSFLHGANSS